MSFCSPLWVMASALPTLSAKTAKAKPLPAAFSMISPPLIWGGRCRPLPFGRFNALSNPPQNRVGHGFMNFQHEFPRYSPYAIRALLQRSAPLRRHGIEHLLHVLDAVLAQLEG